LSITEPDQRKVTIGVLRLVLGHDEKLVHARAILICYGDRFPDDHPGLALEEILIALIGQIGRIAICVASIAFHRLAEEAVHAGLCADLDLRKQDLSVIHILERIFVSIFG
jgi:hypothetical protein